MSTRAFASLINVKSSLGYLERSVANIFHGLTCVTKDAPSIPPSTNVVSTSRRKLRWWFIVGFSLVFVGMLLFMRQFFYTGDALVQCTLWRFYQLELGRAFTSSGALGPTTGSGTQAFTFFLTHVLVSVIAGLFALGLGAIVNRFRQ